LTTDAALRAGLLLCGVALAVAACRQDMHDQPRYKPLAQSDFFADGRAARAPVAGTVARGHLRDDPHLYTGRSVDAFVREFPFKVTAEVLARGRERYGIFCTPCHGRVGDGRGMVARRGLATPASFHIDRLRDAEEGYLFDVISNGFGRMYGYAPQIGVADRWAIVAYLRALQLSQNARLADVPRAERAGLESAAPAAPRKEAP